MEQAHVQIWQYDRHFGSSARRPRASIDVVGQPAGTAANQNRTYRKNRNGDGRCFRCYFAGCSRFGSRRGGGCGVVGGVVGGDGAGQTRSDTTCQYGFAQTLRRRHRYGFRRWVCRPRSRQRRRSCQ